MQGQCGNKGDEDKEREAGGAEAGQSWTMSSKKVSSEPTLYAPEIK